MTAMLQTVPQQGCVGLAGSLSGERTHHAPVFRSATEFLVGRGVPTVLGDDRADAARAVELAEEFAAQGVRLVIGHFNSSCAQAVIPRYRQLGIELLLPASTDPAIRTGNGVFRLCATDDGQVDAIRHWLRDSRPGEVEVRTDGSAYAARLWRGLRDALGECAGMPLDIRHSRACTSPYMVVLALAPAATAFVQGIGIQAANASVLFSDEAAVAAVAQAAAMASARPWVMCPAPSYELLLNSACQLVAEWWPARHEGFGVWIDGCGYFMPTGEAVGAGWNVRRMAELLPPVQSQASQFH